MRDLDSLLPAVRGVRAIVHLAWESHSENSGSHGSDPDNRLMFANVYRAALQAGVPRVVMASSVHADDFRQHTGPPLRADRAPRPQMPYGESKVAMEARGRLHARQGLEGSCACRFGGVTHDERIPQDRREADASLTHRDCVAVIDRCLSAPSIPDRFVVLHAVSENPGRIHDLANPLGWEPVPGAP